MGYQGIMGYGVDFPLSRLGKAIILWVIRVYGLPEVWVKRVSTVCRRLWWRVYVSRSRSQDVNHGLVTALSGVQGYELEFTRHALA